MNEKLKTIVLEDTLTLQGLQEESHRQKGRRKYKELIDVVDDDGSIIGVVDRGFAHRCGLRHLTVNVLVRDKEGEFLLQTRGRGADLKPGRLDITVGGHVQSGAKDLKAEALREMEEEIGLKCSEDELIILSEFNRDSPIDMSKPYVRNRERRVLFLLTLSDGGKEELRVRFPVRSSASEVSGLSWFTQEEVVELIQLNRVADGLRGCFLEYLSMAVAGTC